MSEAGFRLAVGIGGLAILIAALFVYGLARAAAPRRLVVLAALGATAWVAATGIAARSGILLRTDMLPPPFMIMLFASLALGTFVGVSNVGATLARGTPLAVLIGVQGFRFPLELMMHEASRAGMMPSQMSFAGGNFDILSGMGAIVLSVLVAKGAAPRSLVLAWNAMGALLLSTIVIIAAASAPLIHAFGTEPSRINTFVARFPFVWLATILVPAALAGHIVIGRRLAEDG